MSQGVLVINAYTQFDWRGRGGKVDYQAIRNCAEQIAEEHADRRIGLPQIGAGLAGGDWQIILEILLEAFHEVDATVVYYRKE